MLEPIAFTPEKDPGAVLCCCIVLGPGSGPPNPCSCSVTIGSGPFCVVGTAR
jgi:hypothetical protein